MLLTARLQRQTRRELRASERTRLARPRSMAADRGKSMKNNHISVSLIGAICGAALLLPSPALADDDDGGTEISFAGVEEFPVLGGHAVDGASILTRNERGVAYTLSTRGLHPDATYTNWWVSFNNPESCLIPCGCGAADFDNADVDIGVFWATGRFSDGVGQADFSAEVDYGELPAGADQVPFFPAFASPIVPGAEIHLIVRAHGPTVNGGEAQLTRFNGGCPPNPSDDLNGCIDVQFSVHSAAQCDAEDEDDDD